MRRVQVQLTEHQFEALRAHSQQHRHGVAASVREAVDDWIAKRERDVLWDRAIAGIGGFHSGLTDLAENHDKYLGEDGRW